MKKKTAKKVASTVMTAVMITSQVPMVHAYEEQTPAVNESSTVRTLQTRAVGETFTQDAITYTITSAASASRSGKLTVSDGTQAQGDVVIPETIVIDGLNYEVTKIGDRAFAQNAQLTSIDLSNTNLSSSGALGASCFEGCSALTQVLFPDNGSRLSIGRSAFRDCTALTSLTLYDFQVAKNNQPFNGSGIRQITTTSITSLGQNALNGLPDGFTLTCLDSMNVSSLDKSMFGNTTNVTFHVPAAYVDQLTDYFYGDVRVEALQEAVAFLEDGSGSVTGYASLAEAFAAINASSAQGPFTLTVKSGLSTADAYVEYPSTILTKETVIDFQGSSVDLPDTLTLNAPLTIRNVTNFDRQTLCTVDAGTHAFVLENGGSFGFSQISGSDLTFVGKLPGSTPTGEGVVIEGVGADATIHFADIGSSSYYYDLPAIEGFADLQLSNAYLEVSAEQMQDLQAIAMDQAGLRVSGDARIEQLSGNGELRLAEDASLYVTQLAQGTYRMPEVSGQSAPITLPKDSAITITNQNGEAITYAVPAILVSGGDLASASFVDMEEAFAAIAADTQTDADYTITLQDDVVLPIDQDTLTLPEKKMVIDGDGHQLSAGISTRNYIQVSADLTLQDVTLDMEKTYLKNYGTGVTIEVLGDVSGELEQLADKSEASSEAFNQIIVHAPVDKDVIASINGNGKNKNTKIILEGYGSADAAAKKDAYPGIGSGSDGAKPQQFILRDSYIVADSAFNWGNVQLEGNSGLSITGSMQYATLPDYTVSEGANAVLTVKKFSSGFGCLKVNGAVSGQTIVRISGNQMPKVGDVLVQAPGGRWDSFVLEGVEGMELVRRSNGDYVVSEQTVSDPIAQVDGGIYQAKGFATLEDAIDAINVQVAEGSTETYTITLLDDVQLEETLVLPNTAIVLDGAQHTIREAADGSTIDVTKALTIRNAQLELSDSVIHYAPISGTKDRWIRLEETVSGSLMEILDDSQRGYLDISLYPSVQVERVVGTSRSSGSRLTDLILNGYQDTADLPEIVNMAAVELAGCTLTISGDQSNLGTIRTSEDATVSTLRISGDTTLERLSIGNNDNFALVFAPDAQLQLLENSHWLQYAPIEVTVEGDPQDGTPLIRNLTSEEGNSFTLAQGTDTMALYWDAASESLCVSRAPQIAVSADSQGSAASYRAITLQVSDAQQIDHLLINGERVEIDAAQTIIDENSEYLQEGENTIEAVDASGLRSTFTFTLDRQAPQIQIIESEGSEGIYRTLSLLLSDTDQLDKMILNGQEVSLSSLEYTLTQEHASIQEGVNVLEVFDRAGNRASITFTIDTTAPKLQASIQDDVLTITADEAITIEGEGWQRQSDTVWTYVITQETSIDVLATDPAGNTASLRVQVPSLPDTPQTPQEEEPDKDSPTVEPSDEQDVQTAAAAFASLYGAAGVIAAGMSAWLKKRKNRK